LRVNYKDLLVAFCFIIFVLSLLVLTNSTDSNSVIVKILSVENVGNNLEVNASFMYLNNSPYTGSVALKSTAPPGFQPSTQSWAYIPSDGLNSFVIQNRQLQDFDSITIYAEPAEQYNTTLLFNSTWDSPLDNTTVNQTVNQSADNTTVDVEVNSSSNSSIPVIIISNDTNSTIIINTNSSGSGSGSITINDSSDVQTVVPGVVTGGDPNNPSSYTGYKSVKSPVYHSDKALNGSNQDGVSMLNCGLPIDDFLLLCCVIIVFVLIIGRREGG
jgi:hypothetical protein